mmetsp:Transcript_131348/g.366188  ORF Transcript_131348/g.366188 Transcript_131348/m.366188 type:complete len:225 (+) Transcript_131348:1832-2506(+)
MPFARSSFSVFLIFFVSWMSAVLASARMGFSRCSWCSSIRSSTLLLAPALASSSAAPSAPATALRASFSRCGGEESKVTRVRIFSRSGAISSSCTRSRTVQRRPPTVQLERSSSSTPNHLWREGKRLARNVSSASSTPVRSLCHCTQASPMTFSASSNCALHSSWICITACQVSHAPAYAKECARMVASCHPLSTAAQHLAATRQASKGPASWMKGGKAQRRWA